MRSGWWFLLLALSCGGSTASAPPSASAPAPAPAASVPAPSPPQPSPLRVAVWERGTGALPTVILLHGMGDSPEGILPLLQRLPEPVRVLAPAGTLPRGPGWAWLDPPGEDRMPGDRAAELRLQAGRIADLIRERQAEIVGRPVITGFSQGGMLAYAVAVLHPELVAGAVPIGGMLPPELIPARCAVKVPIVALHGEADAVVPVELPRATTSLLVDKAGCDATLRTWPGVEHQITAEMQQVLYAELGRMLPKR